MSYYEQVLQIQQDAERVKSLGPMKRVGEALHLVDETLEILLRMARDLDELKADSEGEFKPGLTA